MSDAGEVVGPALLTEGLRKSFGDVEAVRGVDLVVPRGGFYGFLGPNGAGKSTTIKCLTGLLDPDGGRIEVLGLDPVSAATEVKRRVGVVPENLALFDHLTAPETLRFVGDVFGLEPAVTAERSAELLSVMELDETPNLAVDFSHGMKKKLALSVALLPGPRLLFLDEPFEGIDALASRQIRRILERFVGGGGTVFLTSHILEIVERLCDHLGVIHRGRLVAQGTMAELRAGVGMDRPLEELFLDLVGAEDVEEEGRLSWLQA